MALQEKLTVKANGLSTYSDQLSEVPEGSLSVASNVVINKDGLFSPRRGYENLSGDIDGAIKSLHTYTQDRFNYLLSYREDNADRLLSRYNDDTQQWIDFPTQIEPPSGAVTIKTAQANKNLYLTSSKGVQKLDSVTGDLVDSGAPEGLDITAVDANVGIGSAIPDEANAQAVAYRAVWGYRDANNNLVLGPPSSRVVHNIPGSVAGPSDVDLTIAIPAPPVTENWFLQIYRTAILLGTTPTEVGDPGDSMGLVLERNPEVVDITNQEMTITDVTPDSLRGADLYTNATQQGILQANYTAPQCLDLALYQNHMFYANTQTKYTSTFDLLAVDGAAVPTNSNALQAGDTITINSVVYTARRDADGGEDPSTNHFLVSESASLSDSIGDTARSLIRVINQSPLNDALWAVYDSGEDDIPGKIRTYERDFGDAVSFPIESDRGIAWSPNLSASEGVTADNEAKPNRLYYSKFQQPEAVPILNYFDVGAANDEILRILPLRSILLIFTTAGVYKLTGASASTFQVSLLDDTAVLEAPDSLVALNNTAVGFFDQGVCQVSYGSVQILSRPIEGDLNAIRGKAGNALGQVTFGVSYETDRKYMIGLPLEDDDTQARIIYVYNVFTQSWTTYNMSRRNGLVRKRDDKVYFCSEDAVIRERKAFDDTDFVDPQLDVTVTAVNENIITLTSVVDIRIGYQFWEDDSNYSEITAIDDVNLTITVLDNLEWTTGAAEVRPYITTEIEWNPITADSPNILKQFSEATLLVNRPITKATVSFKTLMCQGVYMHVCIACTARYLLLDG